MRRTRRQAHLGGRAGSAVVTRARSRPAGRRSILVTAAVLVALAGCGGPARHDVTSAPRPSAGATPTPGTVRHDLTVGGTKRSYLLHVPPGTSTKPMPLVVELHGGGGTGEQFEKQTDFYGLADQKGFLVASPDGSGMLDGRLLTWNSGWCCGYSSKNDVDDVGFIAAMLDDLAAHYPVDTRRVYATGFSNGAMMSYRLGCDLTSRFAAIAPVSGALDLDGCAPTRPLPVLAIHGTADQNVPYGGGASTGSRFPAENGRVDRSVADAMTFWTGHDSCPAKPAEQRDGAVVRSTYAPCADGTEVVLYTIEGGRHAWPGGTRGWIGGDKPAPAPDATTTIWDFVSQYRLPA